MTHRNTSTQSQIDKLQYEVDSNKDLFELFRGYTNQHLIKIYQQIGGIVGDLNATGAEVNTLKAQVIEARRSIKSFEKLISDFDNKQIPNTQEGQKFKQDLSHAGLEASQLLEVLSQLNKRVNDTPKVQAQKRRLFNFSL